MPIYGNIKITALNANNDQNKSSFDPARNPYSTIVPVLTNPIIILAPKGVPVFLLAKPKIAGNSPVFAASAAARLHPNAQVTPFEKKVNNAIIPNAIAKVFPAVD